MPAGDDAQAPAAALVFEAEELLQRLVIAEGEVVAADKIPVAGDRPGPGDVALLQRVAPEPVGQVQHLVAGRTVLQPGLRLRRAAILLTPLMADVEVQVLAQAEPQLGDVIRGFVRDERFTRQGYLPGAQVTCLADRRRDQFPAGLVVEDTRRDTHADLIRVRDPVDAEVPILAEQLHQVQIRRDRVEDRDIGLILERHMDIEQARFECLGAVTTAILHCALENHADVQAADRQRALRVGNFTGSPVVQFVLGVIQRYRGHNEPARARDR